MHAAEMSPVEAPHRRKASLGQTARAVFWSFFGVRKRAHYEADSAHFEDGLPQYNKILGSLKWQD